MDSEKSQEPDSTLPPVVQQKYYKNHLQHGTTLTEGHCYENQAGVVSSAQISSQGNLPTKDNDSNQSYTGQDSSYVSEHVSTDDSHILGSRLLNSVNGLNRSDSKSSSVSSMLSEISDQEMKQMVGFSDSDDDIIPVPTGSSLSLTQSTPYSTNNDQNNSNTSSTNNINEISDTSDASDTSSISDISDDSSRFAIPHETNTINNLAHDLPWIYESVNPDIFTHLSFGDSRNDPTVISFNSNDNSLLAYASPERLIVHLTSHEFLNYDTMSDYFLTYRLFMKKDRLVELLITRLAWAFNLTRFHTQNRHGLNSNLEIPTSCAYDIAVRTFVVIRHWILNFFADDFVSSFQLRSKMSDALNRLYRWNIVQNNLQFLRILQQLKKSWLRECCMYWNFGQKNIDSYDLTLPVFPGGAFGRADVALRSNKFPSNDVDRRRLTLLSFYKGPIRPVLSSTELKPIVHNWEAATGSLIRGGITLSGDVEVRLKRSSSGSDNPNNSNYTKINKQKPKNSVVKAFLESLNPDSFKREKFTAKVAQIMDLKHRHTPSVEIRIDILSARVIEELDMILKYQEETASLQNAANDTMEIVDSPSPSPPPSTALDLIDSRQTSVIDSLRIQDKLAHTSDDSDFNTSYSGLPGLNKERFYSTAGGAHGSSHISLHTPLYNTSMATIDSPAASFVSYDSALSEDSVATTVGRAWNDNEINLSHNNRQFALPTLRRLRGQDDLRGVVNFSRPTSLQRRHLRQFSFSQASTASSIEASQSTNTSLDTGEASLSGKSAKFSSDQDEEGCWAFSDVSVDMGVDPKVAAQLASIPDDTPEDDEIRAALMKLEGIYRKQSKPLKSHEENKENIMPLESSSNQKLHSQPQPYSHVRNLSSNKNIIDPISFASDEKSHGESPKTDQQISNSQSSDFDFSIQYNNPSDISHLYQAAFESRLDISDAKKMDVADSDENVKEGDVIQDGSINISSSVEKKFAASYSKVADHSVTSNSHQKTLHRPTASVDSRPAQDPLSVQNSVSHGNHTPFILNFDARTLCHHMTVVERDALAEIDWKDLVELRWNKKLEPIQSWLGLLVEKNVRGVEIVICRFNLVVNWVKSEILLTRSFQERRQTISHYIDIAFEAKQIQNYVTMMQIVLALDSVIIQKLKKTWSALSKPQLSKLASMVEIISPLKNFMNLRMELNTINPYIGCIPFVGIYLSDLVFNGELPTFVEYQPESSCNSLNESSNIDHTDEDNHEPSLINFHKFHTCAKITKGLLQCIEWSKNYTFHTNEDLLAKCLYIHSLTVEEMDVCLSYLFDA